MAEPKPASKEFTLQKTRIRIFALFVGIAFIPLLGGLAVVYPDAQWYTKALLMLFLFLAVVLPVSFFISKRFIAPFEKIFDALQRVSKGDFSVRIHLKAADELEGFGASFNEMTRNLEKGQKEHEEIDKAKSEFLSITSHELRSPITPIKGQLEMLDAEYFGKLTDEQKKSVQIAVRNLKRLDKIIEDFLEISRIEAARLKFEFEPVELETLIREVCQSMETFAPEKKVEFRISGEQLPVIRADPNRIAQVLRNLIGNAIKFSNDPVEIEITAIPYYDSIAIRIRDNGSGISPEDQTRLFEPFFQSNRTLNRSLQGVGLGLAISKGIVESQGGKIEVKSALGKGTTITFTIPLIPVVGLKPIRMLFSSRQKTENDIANLFMESLGPIGKTLFEKLKSENKLNQHDLQEVLDDLHRKKIVSDEIHASVQKQLIRIFNENG